MDELVGAIVNNGHFYFFTRRGTIYELVVDANGAVTDCVLRYSLYDVLRNTQMPGGTPVMTTKSPTIVSAS
jgi:hypothetical protein